MMSKTRGRNIWRMVCYFVSSKFVYHMCVCIQGLSNNVFSILVYSGYSGLMELNYLQGCSYTSIMSLYPLHIIRRAKPFSSPMICSSTTYIRCYISNSLAHALRDKAGGGSMCCHPKS